MELEQESFFADKIITWYKDNKRDLPWRNTTDPYKIWLSEIILQQTRVKQGLPYYEEFIKKYPKIKDLANASLDDVLRTWQGLGYYSRAKNLHYTANYITKELKETFPVTYEEILKLKGVGTYTAAAIASFAYEEEVVVLDGNVYRVLARVFGIEDDISLHKTKHVFLALGELLIKNQPPSLFNQAIMEFGALQCTPKKPNCMFCSLQDICVAFSEGKQMILPVKTKKIKQKKRYFNYLIVEYQNKVLMQKRTEKDIWQELYQFVLLEHGHIFETEKDLCANIFKQNKSHIEISEVSDIYKHQLTHQTIFAKFFHLKVINNLFFNSELIQAFDFFSFEEIKELPKPILLANYLEKYFSN